MYSRITEDSIIFSQRLVSVSIFRAPYFEPCLTMFVLDQTKGDIKEEFDERLSSKLAVCKIKT